MKFQLPKKCHLCKKEIKRGQDYYILNLMHYTCDVETMIKGYKELKEVLYLHTTCLKGANIGKEKT